jgi:hypothetical protein
MNTDKAYLMGLIVGGGIIGTNRENMSINLPYRQWGQVVANPQRAGKIGQDILTRVRPIFYDEYNINITYQVEPEWKIICNGDISALISDLELYGISNFGEIRKNTSIAKLITYLIDDNMKRQFIAGLADTIGSLAPSHRRFTQDYQIISFEINGNNYKLVLEVCKLLRSLNCYTDQILWNHPNQHSTDNPYYKSWKKGFKIRVLLDEYIASASFVFQAKYEAASENRVRQNTVHYATPCEVKEVNINSINTIHKEENSMWLPPEVRGCHFIHHKHICAVMGCEYAPVDSIKKYLDEVENYINPFPILFKGKIIEVHKIIEDDELLKNREYTNVGYDINDLIRVHADNVNALIWGHEVTNGYPVKNILEAIAYILAGQRGNLFGSRVRGNFLDEINLGIREGRINDIKIKLPEILAPAIISDGLYSALIGPQNPKVYKKLVKKDVNNPLKIKVREIKEEDLV